MEKPELSPTVTTRSQKEPGKFVALSNEEASGWNQPSPTLSGAKGVQVWIFPAMNTLMYQHPLTERHLSIVQGELKYRVVGPIGKGLACGDVGVGAMTEWSDIVQMVVEEYHLRPRLPVNGD